MFGAEVDLSQWKGTGLVEGEVPLPEDEAGELAHPARPCLRGPSAELSPLPRPSALAAAAPGLPAFNEAALGMLEGMGFPLIRCQKALLATGNSDGEAAMEWLFAHMEDPGAPLLPHLSQAPF